jgi:hypothetical protein
MNAMTNDQAKPAIDPSTPVRVELKGEVQMTTYALWNVVADALVEKHGGGIPDVKIVHEGAPMLPVSTSTDNDEPPGVNVDEPISETGRARSQADFDLAKKLGFAPAQTIYTRGHRVNDIGVENAALSRIDWEKKPLVTEYCGDFAARITNEERHDVPCLARELTMAADGAFVLRGTSTRYLPTYEALNGLATRIGYGGARYLSKCESPMRAENVNYWRARTERDEDVRHALRVKDAIEAGKDAPEPLLKHLILRARKGAEAGTTETFGVVTPGYTSFDVDKIAAAIKDAVHPEARGTVVYDGVRARFEILFHSDVQPTDYVAGEFFKAGMIVRADDVGGGSISGENVVWQNLCLNLIILDKAAQQMFRIRHVGDHASLVRQFASGFERAQANLDEFTKRWGFACRENVLERTAKAAEVAGDDYVPMKISEAIPGIFNAIIERDAVPVIGRRASAVKQLVKYFDEDQSGAKLHHDGLTRAAVVNAFTRYAHVEPVSVWDADEIQRAAGSLLWPRGAKSEPAPLPYLPLPKYEG